MYKPIRDIHLVVGLFSALFLIAYAVSAVQMVYPVYRPQERHSEERLNIPEGREATARSLASWLMTEHGMRGDLTDVSEVGDTLTFHIERPGTTYDVTVDPERTTATVQTTKVDAIGLLNRIHHIHGNDHQYWATNAWSWFLAVVSAGTIVLALTGTYMWFKRTTERKIGTIVFVVGLVWGLGFLIAVRLA